jgi:hypothetical protein
MTAAATTKRALIIEKTIVITEALTLPDGVGYITIEYDADILGYRAYKAAPAAIEYEGRKYGKSCFNSDRFRIYYRTDMMASVAVICG